MLSDMLYRLVDPRARGMTALTRLAARPEPRLAPAGAAGADLAGLAAPAPQPLAMVGAWRSSAALLLMAAFAPLDRAA